MDAVQETLGEALLVLGSLAAVLFAVILLLLEAKVIVSLGGQLSRELRLGPSAAASRSPARKDGPVPRQGSEEEGREDAAC